MIINRINKYYYKVRDENDVLLLAIESDGAANALNIDAYNNFRNYTVYTNEKDALEPRIKIGTLPTGEECIIVETCWDCVSIVNCMK